MLSPVAAQVFYVDPHSRANALAADGDGRLFAGYFDDGRVIRCETWLGAAVAFIGSVSIWPCMATRRPVCAPPLCAGTTRLLTTGCRMLSKLRITSRAS